MVYFLFLATNQKENNIIELNDKKIFFFYCIALSLFFLFYKIYHMLIIWTKATLDVKKAKLEGYSGDK